MTFAKRITGAMALCVAVMIGSSGMSAQAAFVVDLTQVVDSSQPLGFDVVATGSGTIDLADLSFDSSDDATVAGIVPTAAEILTGSGGPADVYDASLAGPTSFGSGPGGEADSGSGSVVGISAIGANMNVGIVVVPFG